MRHLERFGIIETTKVISALDFLGPSDLGSAPQLAYRASPLAWAHEQGA